MSEEDTSDQETDYDQSLSEDASYIDDTWSEEDDDYGLEPDGEGLEPDPPDQDRDHFHPKSWYEEVEEEEGWRASECENNQLREEYWIDDDSSQGDYEEDTEHGGSYVQPCYNTWRSSQLTPRKLKNKVIYDSQYESSAEPCLFSFSGTRRDYPQWESNLDEYFRYYSIPISKQLAYCLEQLRGEAKRWWRQEEEYRWYYKEPTIRNWGQLKLLMRERYAPPRTAKQSTKASNTSPRRNPAATIQPTRGEVSISNAFENIDKLFDKIQRLIVTNGVVKGLSTQKDREPIKSCEQLMTKKQEIVSASENGIVQAKLSQPVYTAPMTTMMHLPLSISAKTGTGPKDKPSATLGLDPCREVKSEQTKLEETPPGPSSAKLEQPDKQLTDKSSSTLNLSKMVCYKCQNIGHIAKNCPTKRSKNLELNEGESKECDEIVKTDLRIPNASITHLSLPKSVETVSGVESEQCLGVEDNFKEKPPDPAKNTECVDQISLVFASSVSHDASSVLKRLLHIGENEEINCLKPQIEQDFAKNSAKGFDPIDLCCHKESIMHLCLAKKVDLDAGAKEERRRRNSLGENLPINQVPAQRRSVHVLIHATKGERDEPGQTRGTVLSHLLKGEPPDVPNNTIPHIYQGKTLNSQRRMKANLLSMGAGHIVSRTKPFEEGEYDENIKSTSTKEHEEHAHKMTKTLGEDQLEHLNDIGPMIGAHRTDHKELSYNSRCSRNLTHHRNPERKNQPKSFPHEEVMQLTSRRTCKGSERDQLTLVGAERETKAYQWAVTVCTLFPYPWFCPNGFYRKGFNEANWFTYLKPIRKLVGSHGDLRSLFESLRPNREELSCELTWSGILIQFWFSSNWIHTKSYFGLKDIKFLTRRILHLPYLELFEFERLQTYIWRPGDNLNLIEASRDVLSCTNNQRIRRIPTCLFLLQFFPFPSAQSLQRLHSLFSLSMTICVINLGYFLCI